MISQKSISFLITQEDGSRQYYDRAENHWDWPGGQSGPTVGVGYDCGYVTDKECEADWGGIVDHATLTALVRGVGFTGDAAHAFVVRHRDEITITWEQALREFTEREIPKWEARMAKALPNWEYLSPDCAGALLSLGYNRGVGGFNSNLPRYTEMRQIHEYMERGLWGLIPSSIAYMNRLWPNVTDLRLRRALEAQLFAGGVADCKPLKTPPENKEPVA